MGYVNYKCKKCGEIIGVSKKRTHGKTCRGSASFISVQPLDKSKGSKEK